MADLTFVDTNVLVYGRDAVHPDKQKRAAGWIGYLWRTGSGRLSFQVLNEFYITVTRKLRPGMDARAAREDVGELMAWRPISVNHAVLEGAWFIEDRYGLSWWDSLIASAAQISGCKYLLTEDLQDGMVIGDVIVLDPFRHSPVND